METIISACISAGVTLVICIINANKTRVLLEYRLDELTREVREHNEFASRIPVIEEKVNNIDRRVAVLEGRQAS